MRSRTALSMVACLFCTTACASDQTPQAGSYEIVAETVMPHLEENLRYARIQERRCLRRDELSSIFPVLHHPSFDGCRLGNESRSGGAVRYALVCENTQVATGTARLNTRPDRIVGILEIKMGGKNMTFSQHIEAVRQGACETAA